jgi:hypothetical protein
MLSAADATAAVDLSGSWTLDTVLSDNPQQVAAAIREDLGQRDFGVFGGEGGGRYGRGGMGRRGGRQAPEGQARGSVPANDEDQRNLDAVTRTVRYPPPTLQIIQTADAFTVNESPAGTRTFHTSGHREQQMFDATRVNSSAEWQGPQLVIDFDLGRGRKMTYAYSVVPTTRQLLVRITFERGPNQPGPFGIKYVYNSAP